MTFLPALRADLPDHLYWLTERVQGLVRPAAFLMPAHAGSEAPAPMGSTRLCGLVDVPSGGRWDHLGQMAERQDSPYDGETVWLQLDLEEIPEPVRLQHPGLPAQGVVWLTLDLTDRWEAATYFEPTSARKIHWRPRPAHAKAPQNRFVVQETLTYATTATLPEIAEDFRGGVGLCCDYDDWWQKHYGGRQPSDVQVGGWMCPIQGDADTLRTTMLLAIENQPFGDAGAVYLHHCPSRGFWAHAQTH